ncbi:MAG: tRNA pseudouridine(55) synthase TruB [Alphaproteobacteria bacterium]|nr:MAG: tRNA pseudouridine(55) synthase TruB [Alphaproteobacteria bacterium]
MARGRKGRPVDGWLVIDKPAGVTSSAVVNKARWALGARKAGHAGTLDPLATGVLAVAFGEATKTIPYVTDALKCYRFTLRWGIATDSDDAEGQVIAESPLRPDAAAIRAALPAFTGDIMQVPPRVSAVKVAGERAYDLARAGEAFELAARPLHVESFVLRATPDADHAEFELVCGKGGYVRAIARDLGRALGTHAHVTALRRLWAGPFELADAVPLALLDELAGSPELDARLLPLEAGLAELPELPCTAEGAARLRNGNPGMVIAADVGFGEEAWASFEGRAVAIGTYRAGMLHPTRVLRGD